MSSVISACACSYDSLLELRITEFAKCVSKIFPFGLTVRNTLFTSLSSSSTRLHMPFESLNGSMGITVPTRYVEFPRFAASRSSGEEGFTYFETSAM